MTYNTVGKIASSQGLNKRVNACAAQEGAVNMSMWVLNNIWTVAASPGWAEAWEAAEGNMTDNDNPDLGARSNVITDGMILAAVQPIVQAEKAAAEAREASLTQHSQ
jgi:hypothetical protein